MSLNQDLFEPLPPGKARQVFQTSDPTWSHAVRMAEEMLDYVCSGHVGLTSVTRLERCAPPQALPEGRSYMFHDESGSLPLSARITFGRETSKNVIVSTEGDASVVDSSFAALMAIMQGIVDGRG